MLPADLFRMQRRAEIAFSQVGQNGDDHLTFFFGAGTDLERLIARLFQKKADTGEVVAAIGADRSLSEAQKHAAIRAVLQRSAK